MGLVGFVAVVLYGVFGAVQILVLNPLAAAPGRTLAEVYALVDAAGEPIPVAPVLVVLGFGVLLGAVIAALSFRPRATTAAVSLGILGILAGGAPAYFVASFGPGMALADGLETTGADHSQWSILLYAVSLLAVAGMVVVGMGTSRRTNVPAVP